MPRFNGLSDQQWNFLEPLLPQAPARKKAGRPRNSWRKLLNSIFWMMLTGSRWCDIPDHPDFAKKTASNFWLRRFRQDGTLEKIFDALREIARLSNQIDWQRLAVDGSFSPTKGHGCGGTYGHKGKGFTTHLLADKRGNPLAVRVTGANANELQQVMPMLKEVRPPKHSVLEADKGYDSEPFRYKINWLLGMGSAIPKRNFKQKSPQQSPP